MLVAVIVPLVLAARQLLQGPRGSLRRRSRAQPRVPRHGDAALGRPRVRGRVHRAALALGRRPGQRGRRRARASRRTSARSWSSRRCCTTSARSRFPRRSSTSPRRSPTREFEVIKHHTIEGQFMLDRVGGLLARVGEVVRSCHERWDGRGYPDGLAGEQIPIAARIVFACDAYNAMTTDRPYRAAMPREAARRGAARQHRHAVRPEGRRGAHQGRRAGRPRDAHRQRRVRAVLAGAPGRPERRRSRLASRSAGWLALGASQASREARIARRPTPAAPPRPR